MVAPSARGAADRSVHAMMTILRKEFNGVFKERTILLAVFIQVFVAGFSSLLVVGLSALVDPSAIPDYTEPEVATDSDGRIIELMQAHGLEVRRVADEAEGMALFRSGRVDAYVRVDEPTEAGGAYDVHVVLPDADMMATLTLVQLKDVLEAYEQELRDERAARLVYEPLYVQADAETSQYAFVYSLLIPLLVFLPIILSGGLMADSMTEEVQRGTLPLLLVGPVTVHDIIGGKLAANTLITPLLSLAWLFLLWLNGFVLPPTGAVLIVVMSTAVAFLAGLMAAAVALVVRDRDRAQVIYALLFFFVAGLSLMAPTSPVNAIALLAAGSAHPGVYVTVTASLLLCVVGWGALRVSLRNAGGWMADADGR